MSGLTGKLSLWGGEDDMGKRSKKSGRDFTAPPDREKLNLNYEKI